MIRLSKKAEYAILAMQYMSLSDGYKASAREIAQYLNISFEFLSKTMQKLMKRGIIVSQKGMNGGYILSVKPSELTIADIINALEENTKLVQCADDKIPCTRDKECTIKENMLYLQREIDNVFSKVTIADMSKSLQLN